MYGIVYVTENIANGMKYIGQHQCKDENDSYLGSGVALVADIKKYGRQCFERHTLYVAESQDELNEMEIAFIKAFNAVENENYYNFAKGGLSVAGEMNPMFGHVYTEEERKKIGDGQREEKHWNYGKHWPEEIKEKMRHPHNGNSSWAKGKVRAPEHCKHISESKKGKKPNISEEGRKRKAIYLSERNKTEKFKQQVSEANKRVHQQGVRRGNKPVVCIETGIVYASIADAGKSIGVHYTSISACLNNKQETAGKFHWRFASFEETAGEMVYVA